MKEKINIVWLKRDLRTTDHEPLHLAQNHEQDYIIIYIFDPVLISEPDWSIRHQQFIYHSLLEMKKELNQHQRTIHIFYGDSIKIFNYLNSIFSLDNVYSFQEYGTEKSWERDKSVKNFFKQNNIQWVDIKNQSIKRGAKNRKKWDKDWYVYANQNCIINSFTKSTIKSFENPFGLSSKQKNILNKYEKELQPAGQNYAVKYLHSFILKRGKEYSKNISSPQKSRYSCSRLSIYLSWGNLSIRQVYQATIKSENYHKHKRSFDAFLARLKWRSHFIQKFETDCSYEKVCINRGYEKMIYENNNLALEKWKKGQTGFPLVDASMRCLIHTGWINFRMRAMLVSFLCHHLNQDWRRGVYHMAKLFLDYEPGIHFTQFQMQAGVTGINSIRIYNPIKQSIEKDTDGIFIKKWVPELKDLEIPFIHKPWKMTNIDLLSKGIELNYPTPIVEPIKAVRKTRNQLWELRKDPMVINESKRLLKIHVRPKNIVQKK